MQTVQYSQQSQIRRTRSEERVNDISRLGCKRREHEAEIFSRVSYESEYIEGNKKGQKEEHKRKRGGIIVAVGIRFERAPTQLRETTVSHGQSTA
jgi:phage regulator Rha-like protein